MVLSSQHNHNTEGFYFSTPKKRHKPSIIKGLRAFFKISLFLYIIKIRKNPSRPLFSRVRRVFFTPCRSPFLILEKSRFLLRWNLHPFTLPRRRTPQGKNTPAGSTFASVREGVLHRKRLRFFLRLKIGSLLYLCI